MKFQDATAAEINIVMNAAWQAFHDVPQTTLKQRADLMRRIAKEMEAAHEFIQTAMRETNLPETALATNGPEPNSN
jgi:alpha-ketoglutaric semialdehyde dehydrogenase